jgi:hypothetical protein
LEHALAKRGSIYNFEVSLGNIQFSPGRIQLSPERSQLKSEICQFISSRKKLKLNGRCETIVIQFYG